jgi:hypothetical protein
MSAEPVGEAVSTGDPRQYRDDSPVSRERGFCPCCGYQTLAPDTPGSYEVCPVCYWLDDLVAFYAPEYESEYNHLSLEQARANFAEHGAITPAAVSRTRAPRDGEVRDPNWPYGE